MRRTLAVLAGVLILLFMPTTAEAKGPTGGTLDGEGIAAPIEVPGSEETGGIAALADATGFFAAAFGQQPDPMLHEAPTAELGRRLTMSWTLPSGPSTEGIVTQDIYPLAAGGPLTYTAPGQPFFGSEHTRGGWYRAPTSLTDLLGKLGVPGVSSTKPAVTAPAAAPAPANGSSTSWTAPALGLLLGAALAVLATRFSIRRRSRVPATT